MSTTATPNPLRELADYLAKHATRCRSQGWFASLFHVSVTQDIAGEVAANEAKASKAAHLSECEDIEAAQLIEAALDDRALPAAAVPVLREALRHVRASAKADHNVTETLA